MLDEFAHQTRTVWLIVQKAEISEKFLNEFLSQ